MSENCEVHSEICDHGVDYTRAFLYKTILNHHLTITSHQNYTNMQDKDKDKDTIKTKHSPTCAWHGWVLKYYCSMAALNGPGCLQMPAFRSQPAHEDLKGQFQNWPTYERFSNYGSKRHGL